MTCILTLHLPAVTAVVLCCVHKRVPCCDMCHAVLKTCWCCTEHACKAPCLHDTAVLAKQVVGSTCMTVKKDKYKTKICETPQMLNNMYKQDWTQGHDMLVPLLKSHAWVSC